MKKHLVLVFLLLPAMAGSASVVYAQVSEEWVARYNGLGNGSDEGKAIALDAGGNAYVTGYSWGMGTLEDYATVKYDPAGNQLWVARYNGPGNGSDIANAIAVDANGNVYVTGRSYGGVSTGNDYATVKYDTNGNQLWVARYDGPGISTDIAFAIALDVDANVYVTGSSGGGFTRYYATVKYDPAGNQLWVARYNGPGNGSDIAYAIALDADANVYVTGGSYGGGVTLVDYATVKYDTNGNQLWVARYNGPASRDDVSNAIALDADGNVYVTGQAAGVFVVDFYCVTVKYNSAGNQLWVAYYGGEGYRFNSGNAIALDADGYVYVTGWSARIPGRDYVTIKYAQK